MAGGGGVVTGGKIYAGRFTFFVALASIVAASGGLIFGYDIGISGGVTSMNDFLAKFFPSILSKTGKNNYCQYDNQGLQAFTSSLYLAGLVATCFASYTTRYWGRRPSMLIGGVSFLCGAILNAAAQDLAMLIIGRILLGIGVGFANQAVPLYLSEMAPATYRGALNIMFQLATTIGILCANVINYGTGKLTPWGWRLSLGLAAVPACLLTVGGLTLPETPNSLIERDYTEAGRKMLVRIRGVEDVGEEYSDLVEASTVAKAIEHPWRNLLQRRYRPQLTMAILIPFFQQVTGINAIMFYAPVLFKTIGFGSDASLYSAVITGAVNVVATFVSVATVDKWGRKLLFLEGGIQMFVCQVCIGAILKYKLGEYGVLSKSVSGLVVALICIYVAAFAWSWGPLGWLVPSEIFPLEIRSAAQSVTVFVNFLFTFVVGQAFLTMLCKFEYGIFFFFAGWVLIMTVFTSVFLPETKNVPIEEMVVVWRRHWFWGRFVGQDSSTQEFEESGKPV